MIYVPLEKRKMLYPIAWSKKLYFWFKITKMHIFKWEQEALHFVLWRPGLNLSSVRIFFFLAFISRQKKSWRKISCEFEVIIEAWSIYSATLKSILISHWIFPRATLYFMYRWRKTSAAISEWSIFSGKSQPNPHSTPFFSPTHNAHEQVNALSYLCKVT